MELRHWENVLKALAEKISTFELLYNMEREQHEETKKALKHAQEELEIAKSELKFANAQLDEIHIGV